MSEQIVEPKLRTVLVVGATEDDARAFIADVDRRRSVPDEMWPMGETLRGSFASPEQVGGAIDRGYGYDLVFITRGAFAAMDYEQVLVAASLARAHVWSEASLAIGRAAASTC